MKMLLMLLILISIKISVLPDKVYCEGKETTELKIKVKTDGLSPFNKWWVDMYNDNRVEYSIYVTLVMLLLGVTVGFGTDLILRLFGFKTTKIVHHE